jgi:hypothetical protein
MIRFFGNDRRRVAHALKVYSYVTAMAELEALPSGPAETARAAAILHDTGIKAAEEKYGSCTVRQQQEEGPPVAGRILAALGAGRELTERAQYLIAHHHEPGASEDMDFRLIIEADYLVNFEEGNIPLEALGGVVENHFRTETGKEFARLLFAGRT